jgi:hypothetical protein
MEELFVMSAPYNFELLKNGQRVLTHAWRSWVDPHDAKEYKDRCLRSLNDWHESQGKEYGGTIKNTVPMIPEIDAIRFEWPPGNIVTVAIESKTSL